MSTASPTHPASTNVLSLYEAIDKTSPAWLHAAERIQGNIVEPHGRQFSALLTIQFAGTQSKLELGKFALRWLTTAGEQSRRTGPRRNRRSQYPQGEYADRKIFGFLYLSSNGYRKLGYCDQLNEAFADSWKGKDNWFLTGLQNEQSLLKFPDEDMIRLEPAYEWPMDAMLLLGSDHSDVLDGAVEDAKAGIQRFGMVLGIERGAVKRDANGQSIEAFGFADAISKPQVFNDTDPLFGYPSQLLVNDPFVGQEPNAFGSYLVYCKLEQDTAAFDKAVCELGWKIKRSAADTEALMIGRYKDGTPLALNPNCPHDPATRRTSAPDFANDLDGLKCPYQAHIRKANPRITPQGTPVNNLIFRRSMRYDYSEAEPSTAGLLFMAFQSHIARVFGEILLTWVNKSEFPVEGTGSDALMGNRCGKQTWTPEANPSEIARFITLKGGEFLFAPSLPFFESLVRPLRSAPKPPVEVDR